MTRLDRALHAAYAAGYTAWMVGNSTAPTTLPDHLLAAWRRGYHAAVKAAPDLRRPPTYALVP